MKDCDENEHVKDTGKINMMDDSLSDTQIGKPLKIVNLDKAMAPNVYAKQIWNEAIEAAAGCLTTSYPEHAFINAYCAAIRSLKK